MPRSGLETRFSYQVAGFAAQAIGEPCQHVDGDVLRPAFDGADVVPVAVGRFRESFLGQAETFAPLSNSQSKPLSIPQSIFAVFHACQHIILVH